MLYLFLQSLLNVLIIGCDTFYLSFVFFECNVLVFSAKLFLGEFFLEPVHLIIVGFKRLTHDSLFVILLLQLVAQLADLFLELFLHLVLQTNVVLVILQFFLDLIALVLLGVQLSLSLLRSAQHLLFLLSQNVGCVQHLPRHLRQSDVPVGDHVSLTERIVHLLKQAGLSLLV